MGLFSGGNSSSSSTIQNPEASAQNGGDFSGQITAGNGNRSIGAGSLATFADVSGTGNTVAMLDAGAVSKSLELALAGVEGANKLATTTVARSGELLAGIYDRQADTGDKLAQAVTEAKTSDVRVMVIGALAIVAAVVAVMFKKGT